MNSNCEVRGCDASAWSISRGPTSSPASQCSVTFPVWFLGGPIPVFNPVSSVFFNSTERTMVPRLVHSPPDLPTLAIRWPMTIIFQKGLILVIGMCSVPMKI